MTIIPPPQATATLMRAAATIVEHVRAILKVRHPCISPYQIYLVLLCCDAHLYSAGYPEARQAVGSLHPKLGLLRGVLLKFCRSSVHSAFCVQATQVPLVRPAKQFGCALRYLGHRGFALPGSPPVSRALQGLSCECVESIISVSGMRLQAPPLVY